MKNRRGEGGVGATGCEHVGEVREGARPSRGYHWYRHGFRYRRGQLAVEPGLGPIPIDGGEQDLTGPALGRLACPFDRGARGVLLATTNPNGKSSIETSRVDRDDDRLAAVTSREHRDQCRLLDRGGVEADLVRAGVNRHRGIVFAADTAADAKLEKNPLRDGLNRVRPGAPGFEG